MTDSDPPAEIRFYFSFRSPYAWLATEALEDELGDLGIPIERIPIYPTPGNFPNDPVAVPHKTAYIVQDVRRLARERGLRVRFPSAVDSEWSRPHAAFLGADQQGGGHPFMLQLFRKRFLEGLDVGQDEVIADAATGAGLDRQRILDAAHSETLRAEVFEGWQRAGERDGVFGVPTFTYGAELFWGQDRLRHLVDAVHRKRAE